MENLIELTHLPFFDEHECLEIIQYIEEKENYFKQNSTDKFDKHFKKNDELENIQHYPVLENDIKYGKDRNYTTLLNHSYNFFKDNPKYIPRLKKFLKNKFPELNYPLFVQSWGNFYKKNQNIKWHKHSDHPNQPTKGLTANFFIGGDENLGVTYAFPYKDCPRYKYHHEKNKLGHIQLVDNTIYHMVRSNDSNQKRYTIGATINEFDIKYSKRFIYDAVFSEDTIILFDSESSYDDNSYIEEKQELFNYS